MRLYWTGEKIWGGGLNAKAVKFSMKLEMRRNSAIGGFAHDRCRVQMPQDWDVVNVVVDRVGDSDPAPIDTSPGYLGD
jgi:hypothetical protein